MSNHVLLNNIDHKDLRIITRRSAALGDNVMYSYTFPFEFRNIQAHYPIFFQKDPNSDRYYPLAMLGLRRDENLFLSDAGWHAPYIPVAMERQPFLIGFEGGMGGGEPQSVVHVDMDSPRVSKSEGEPLFLEHGATRRSLIVSRHYSTPCSTATVKTGLSVRRWWNMSSSNPSIWTLNCVTAPKTASPVSTPSARRSWPPLALMHWPPFTRKATCRRFIWCLRPIPISVGWLTA
nr:SapC family protein [Kordiimonas gwangyangensis]